MRTWCIVAALCAGCTDEIDGSYELRGCNVVTIEISGGAVVGADRTILVGAAVESMTGEPNVVFEKTFGVSGSDPGHMTVHWDLWLNRDGGVGKERSPSTDCDVTARRL